METHQILMLITFGLGTVFGLVFAFVDVDGPRPVRIRIREFLIGFFCIPLLALSLYLLVYFFRLFWQEGFH